MNVSPVHKRQGGFSIIELMIVVAMVALLLSVGVPSFGTLIRNQQLSAITTDLMSSLLLARSEAIRRNQKVYICGGTNGCTYGGTPYNTNLSLASLRSSQGWAVFVDGSNNGIFNGPFDCDNRANDCMLAQMSGSIPSGYDAVMATSSGGNTLGYSRVGYNASGVLGYYDTGTSSFTALQVPMQVSVCKDSDVAQSREIEVSLSGRPRVVKDANGRAAQATRCPP